MSALTTLLQRRSHSTTMNSDITTSRLARATQLRGYSGCLLLIYFSLRHKGEKDEDDEMDLTILNHRFNFISFFWLPRTMGDKEVERMDFLFSHQPITATFQYLYCYCQCYCPPSFPLSLFFSVSISFSGENVQSWPL